MKRKIILLLVLLLLFLLVLSKPSDETQVKLDNKIWEIQSVDTMKTSRDRARENISNQEILKEIQAAKNLGANYISLGTPYDQEFYPTLKRWADLSHEQGLSVWFRGNFSGWEGWFEYPKNLTRVQHLKKTKDFILNHPELFQDGDSFTPCPECENGGPGDPRQTGDHKSFNQFFIDLHNTGTQAFQAINKDIHVNWFSTNGDIAKQVLDKQTVNQIGNLITIDHYVNTPQRLEKDLIELHNKFDANILLGEFGAPIPNIHGNLNQNQQKELINQMLLVLYKHRSFVKGINYWTSRHASTSILNPNFSPKPAAHTLESFWLPGVVTVKITDELNRPITDSDILINNKVLTNQISNLSFPIPEGQHTLKVTNNRYHSSEVTINPDNEKTITLTIKLQPKEPSLIYRLILNLKTILENSLNSFQFTRS